LSADQPDLRAGYAQHRHGHRLLDQPGGKAAPQRRFDLLVDRPLFLQGPGVEQIEQPRSKIPAGTQQIAAQNPGDGPGRAVVVERPLAPGTIEVGDFFVPEGPGITGQARPHRPVQITKRLVRTVSEHAEQIVEVAALDQRQLEPQQRVLTGIDIHRVNLRRIVQQIVQGVAPGAGEHHHPAVPVQFQDLSVDAGVFPTDVVNQAAVMNRLEHQIVGAVDQFHTELLDHMTDRRGDSRKQLLNLS
jgi:hypothetical protein